MKNTQKPGSLLSHTSRRRLGFQTLENRRVLAEIAIGVEFFADVNDRPGAVIDDPVEVGEAFWVGIVVQDQRTGVDTTPGVIALPVSIDWDPAILELVSPTTDAIPGAMGPIPLDDVGSLLLTGRFPLNRSLGDFRPDAGPLPADASNLTADQIDAAFNLVTLQGAATPANNNGQPIGQTLPDANAANASDLSSSLLSLFRVESRAIADPTAINIRLSGAASVADADVIQDVVPLDGFRTVDVPEIPNTVRAPLRVAPIVQQGTASIGGRVFVDTNSDGNVDAQEVGVPGVPITLLNSLGAAVAETQTGADGEYRFSGLEAGTYRVVQTQPAGLADVSINVGMTGPASGPIGNAVGLNEVAGIVLADGDQATDYNFGERIAVLTKKMFMASTDPRLEFCQAVDARCAVVAGTDGDDTVEVQRDASGVTVRINGSAPLNVPVDLLDALMIDLGSGNDTVTFDDQLAGVGTPAVNVFESPERDYRGLLPTPTSGLSIGVFLE